MSDPFGDLDETLDDGTDGAGSAEETADTDSSRSDATETRESTEATESTETDEPTERETDGREEAAGGGQSGDGEDADSAADDGSSPAFPFAEADQTAVYPRGETWASFEDFLDFEVRRRLREAGVRDDTKRELHEAALQVIQDHPEAVTEQFLANRRE